jgi:predicted ATPase
MGDPLKLLSIEGFKSIKSLKDFELRKLNLLIGANGAGKSNFVDFFRMLRALADEGFQKYVNEQSGADGFFFLGPKVTRQISAHLAFGQNVYEFDLAPAGPSSLQIASERVQYTGGSGMGTLRTISSGQMESVLKKKQDEPALVGTGRGVPGYVYDSVASWTVYHFHDTSSVAPMRRDQSVRDRDRLRHDAANIAAFLLHLRDTDRGCYDLIRDTIRLIAPFFQDFLLRPETRGGAEQVRLEWLQKGSDFPFQPQQLSDGTIRFICLTAVLAQPSPPATIVIDEPELGLHPFAIAMLANLIKSASERTQTVVCTQSPILLDFFEPEDVVTVNRVAGASHLERLQAEQLKEWLDEYSVGELWQKDVVRGGPTDG